MCRQVGDGGAPGSFATPDLSTHPRYKGVFRMTHALDRRRAATWLTAFLAAFYTYIFS
jgi:hypothetical protein